MEKINCSRVRFKIIHNGLRHVERIQKTKSFIRIRKVTIRQIMIGVMYFLNNSDIFKFFAPFLKSLLLDASLADCV